MNPHHKQSLEQTLRELRRPADKRELGGHGDKDGFFLLLYVVDQYDPDGKIDLFDVELPLDIKCSTCRFMTPEFHERMPCWVCIDSEFPLLPKWRARK